MILEHEGAMAWARRAPCLSMGWWREQAARPENDEPLEELPAFVDCWAALPLPLFRLRLRLPLRLLLPVLL